MTTTTNAKRRLPWDHESRHCVYCSKVGPRVIVTGGFAHKYCIPKGHPEHPDTRKKNDHQR